MNDSNDNFDLPRWASDTFTGYHDPLSSSAQAAQAAQQSYHSSPFNGPPPPPQSSSARPTINTHHSGNANSESQPSSARNPRITHFFENDNQYLSTGQANLSRSASLGNPIGNSAGLGAYSTRRRQHMQGDLESAYFEDAGQGNTVERHQPARSLGSSQQIQQSFYPSSVAYATPQQPPPLPGHSSNAPMDSPSTSDPYQDAHYNGGQSHTRKNTIKVEDTGSAGRSPRRQQAGSNLTDPYAQLQQLSSQSTPSTAYSPTSTVYQYSNPTEMPTASPYQPQQQTPKTVTGPNSPLSSPFSGHRNLPPPPSYSHYAMDTTSPGPSHASQAGIQHGYSAPGTTPIRQSLSTPNTPLSYQHAQQLAQAQYHTAPPDDPMGMETNLHKRRASGFKRIRDARELKPYVNSQPAGRRGDANGQFLSVSHICVIYTHEGLTDRASIRPLQPLRQLTTNITDTYHICNPQFRYESASNPRRVLTKPSKPAHNDGYDNEDYDYILYVNDLLGSDQNKCVCIAIFYY